MEIIRVIKNKNYSTINNEILRDKGISLKAKGLLITILSLPPGWDLTISGMSVIVKEGKRSVASAINELIEFGYIKRNAIKNGTMFAGYEYYVYESPKCGFVDTGNGDTQNVDTQNSTQLNTYKNKTLNNKVKINGGRFKKPLISEISFYIEERGNLINANKFFDYYESNGWKVGKNKMKCWKAAVRNWENMRKDKGQMESKVMERLSSHDKAKEILKNMHNGN